MHPRIVPENQHRLRGLVEPLDDAQDHLRRREVEFGPLHDGRRVDSESSGDCLGRGRGADRRARHDEVGRDSAGLQGLRHPRAIAASAVVEGAVVVG